MTAPLNPCPVPGCCQVGPRLRDHGPFSPNDQHRYEVNCSDGLPGHNIRVLAESEEEAVKLWNGMTSPKAPASPYNGMPGHKGTDTSHAMAEKIKPKADLLRKRVLGALRDHFYAGATSYQISLLLNEPDVTVKPRLSELKAKGVIRDSGRRGPSAYNNPSIIWIINEGASHVETEKTTQA